jgi:hypothetical protein
MESSWVTFNLKIKIRNKNPLFIEKEDNFDFSPWLPPPIMQFVFTKEISTLQNVLQMRGYVLEFDGNQIDVSHVSGKTRTSPQCVGDSICNVLSGFISRYDARPVLIPTKFGKIDFKTLALQNVMVTWDKEKSCYWLSGAEEDVDKAYSIVQRQQPYLWDIPKDVSFDVSLLFNFSLHSCLSLKRKIHCGLCNTV